MSCFAKIINGVEVSAILAKRFILDIGLGPKYTCDKYMADLNSKSYQTSKIEILQKQFSVQKYF